MVDSEYPKKKETAVRLARSFSFLFRCDLGVSAL